MVCWSGVRGSDGNEEAKKKVRELRAKPFTRAEAKPMVVDCKDQIVRLGVLLPVSSTRRL